MERAKKGVMREVPNLQERRIIRDSWTKLNVSPAKIMQVLHYNNSHVFILRLSHRF